MYVIWCISYGTYHDIQYIKCGDHRLICGALFCSGLSRVPCGKLRLKFVVRKLTGFRPSHLRSRLILPSVDITTMSSLPLTISKWLYIIWITWVYSEISIKIFSFKPLVGMVVYWTWAEITCRSTLSWRHFSTLHRTILLVLDLFLLWTCTRTLYK